MASVVVLRDVVYSSSMVFNCPGYGEGRNPQTDSVRPRNLTLAPLLLIWKPSAFPAGPSKRSTHLLMIRIITMTMAGGGSTVTNCLLPISGAWVQSQDRSCEICGGQEWQFKRLSSSTARSHSTNLSRGNGVHRGL